MDLSFSIMQGGSSMVEPGLSIEAMDLCSKAYGIILCPSQVSCLAKSVTAAGREIDFLRYTTASSCCPNANC